MALRRGATTLDLQGIRGYANHLQKYIRAVEAELPLLQRELRRQGLDKRIDWTRLPSGVGRQMRLIRDAAPDTDTAVRWLGAFYAWHYLRLNQKRLGTLKRGLERGQDATE